MSAFYWTRSQVIFFYLFFRYWRCK